MGNKKQVLQYLEEAYTGARMLDDLDAMVKIARAIEAFNLPTDMDCVIEPKQIREETMDAVEFLEQYKLMCGNYDCDDGWSYVKI